MSIVVTKPVRGRRPILVLLATLVAVAVTSRLGLWQLDRAAQKEAIQAAQEARARLPVIDGASLARSVVQAAEQHHRPVQLKGRWLADRTVFLDNRQVKGRPGFFVVTPLLLGSGDAVLVQRGWAPRDMLDRARLPNVASASGEVEVLGSIAPPPARLYEFSPEVRGPIRQNLDLAEYAIETGLSLRPLSVLQRDSADTSSDGLLRQWPRPAVDVHKNYGYAFQWFALAALMTGLYVWFQLIRPRLRGSA